MLLSVGVDANKIIAIVLFILFLWIFLVLTEFYNSEKKLLLEAVYSYVWMDGQTDRHTHTHTHTCAILSTLIVIDV